jgi:chemotaxis protein MotB
MSLRSKRLHFSDHIDSEGSWAVSYGDMITLLLSFFVIYFSTDFNKQVEEKLGKKVEQELAKVNHDLKIDSDFLSSESLKHIPLKDGEEIPSNIDIKIYKSGKSFLIRFEGVSFFNSGKTIIRDDAKKVLQAVVKRLEPFLANYKVKIRAFTDSRKVSPGRRYHDNLELSALRAISTMRILEREGIPRSRMEVAGYGVMSDALLKFLNIKTEDHKEKNALSRSVMLLLKRDSYEKS